MGAVNAFTGESYQPKLEETQSSIIRTLSTNKWEDTIMTNHLQMNRKNSFEA